MIYIMRHWAITKSACLRLSFTIGFEIPTKVCMSILVSEHLEYFLFSIVDDVLAAILRIGYRTSFIEFSFFISEWQALSALKKDDRDAGLIRNSSLQRSYIYVKAFICECFTPILIKLAKG